MRDVMPGYLGIITFLETGMDTFGLAIGLPLLLVWSAAWWDWRERRIPNPIVLAGIVLGMCLQGMLAASNGILDGAAGLAVGMAVLMPGYVMGTTGAGDVKLMGAVGTFLGPSNTLYAALASIGVGGLVAMGFLVASAFARQYGSPWQRYGLMFRSLWATGRLTYLRPADTELMGQRFPFAISIALGTTLFLLW